MGQFHQIEGFFRAVGGPFADPAHDRPLLVASAQGVALQALAGIVEDEQTVFEQLLGQSLAFERAVGIGQSREGGAQPTAEQRVLAAAQRHHEQPVEAFHIQAVTGHERLVEHNGHLLVVLGVIQMLRLSSLSRYRLFSLRSKQNASDPLGARKNCSTRVLRRSS